MVLITMASIITVATVYVLFNPSLNQNKEKLDFHVGVAFGGNTTAEAKLLIDKVKGYTNLFVIQSGPVSVNETALYEIGDYAVDSGLDLIVYFGFFNPNYPWQRPWLDFAKQRWGDRFLGVYLNDEPAGVLIDFGWTEYYTGIRARNTSHYYLHAEAIESALNGTLPQDLDEATNHFLTYVDLFGLEELKNRSITSFTSDYALYWFDYLGGYDVMLAQFGWNHTTNQDIALVRGAAKMQNKNWGAIITWTYDQPPYLASREEIYCQMVSAYRAGAKYVVIFDYPQLPGNPYGILTEEHFLALETFWGNIQNRELTVEPDAQAVLVLPQNYGWGMRNMFDSIWGVWGADEQSEQIWNISRKLLSQYGLHLDIIYEDSRFPVEGKYPQVFYWNQIL